MLIGGNEPRPQAQQQFRCGGHAHGIAPLADILQTQTFLTKDIQAVRHGLHALLGQRLGIGRALAGFGEKTRQISVELCRAGFGLPVPIGDYLAVAFFKLAAVQHLFRQAQ